MGHSRSKVMMNLERSFPISSLANSNFGHRIRCLRDICDFSLEPFFWIPVLTLRGRRRSKVKEDLGVLGMGSY